MSTELIQSNYEALAEVAARFEKNRERIQQTHTAIQRKAQVLARTWEGRGAQSFQRELQSTLYPALQRLTNALGQAEAVTRKISQSVLQAEEEAARLFQGQGTTGGSEGRDGSGASGATGGSEGRDGSGMSGATGGSEGRDGSGGGDGFGGMGGGGLDNGGFGEPQMMFASFTPGSDQAQVIPASDSASGDESAAEATATEPDVDWGFISDREGGQALDGYVPAPEVSKSGVTVGTGFDIGQRTESDIDAMDIPDTLKEKLKPYAGLIKQDAVDFLADNPLTITQEEATALDKAVKQKALDTLVTRYDNATTGTKFADLPQEMQTVLASVEFQYGSMSAKTPNFWKMVTEQRWDDAIAELRDFGDKYPTRRGLEADLLQEGVDSLPADTTTTTAPTTNTITI
jgi:WXG100 family type VII secretion target